MHRTQKMCPGHNCVLDALGLFVGNAKFAESEQCLEKDAIYRIVYCQGMSGQMRFKDYQPAPLSRSVEYYDFRIGEFKPWKGREAKEGSREFAERVEEVEKLFSPLFAVVGEWLGNGENVLVHCKAGRHRAGTAGVGLLMHFRGLSREEATALAKSRHGTSLAWYGTARPARLTCKSKSLKQI